MLLFLTIISVFILLLLFIVIINQIKILKEDKITKKTIDEKMLNDYLDFNIKGCSKKGIDVDLYKRILRSIEIKECKEDK